MQSVNRFISRYEIHAIRSLSGTNHFRRCHGQKTICRDVGKRTRWERFYWIVLACTFLACIPLQGWGQDVVVKGKTIHTMAGSPINNGVVVVRDGRIQQVGPAGQVVIPDGVPVVSAEVVVPGLVDARSTVGLSGIYNVPHDQDQLEHSEPIQPGLRALDAYNADEKLIAFLRELGVTTIHTGHAPGELISGQTFIAKTQGATMEDAVVVEVAAVAATLSEQARKENKKSPGTRAKMVSMLRAKLYQAQEYLAKQKQPTTDEKKVLEKDLHLDALALVLQKKIPLLVTANRATDIMNALRIKKEFEIDLWLDMAADAHLLIDEIKAAEVPVILHPSMYRAYGDTQNLSFETAAKLVKAGIPVAIQSGYEPYVPKTRVVLFEAALAAANGLSFAEALGTITIEPARILGIDKLVGSIEKGKHGDLALYDGDPFEYTTHCVGVVIEGRIVSQESR